MTTDTITSETDWEIVNTECDLNTVKFNIHRKLEMLLVEKIYNSITEKLSPNYSWSPCYNKAHGSSCL